jgi:spore maturation protein CgeB
MRIAIFCHSFLSDWNHGNAHFVRGVVSELAARGHDVLTFEPRDAWSVLNLERDHGPGAIELARGAYPTLEPTRYDLATLDLERELASVDAVIVHEWSDHDLVRRIGDLRKQSGRFVLLFHDTHHRMVTDPESMLAYDLSGYDGVLAFGAAIRELYERAGWGRRAYVWHEAADTRVFYPQPGKAEGDVVFIGNWGDDERTRELTEFLLEPVGELGLVGRVHGVRYPPSGLAALAGAGIAYAGWLPNFRVPEVFGRFRMTVHIPRGPYVRALPGIPTIRPFEAMACGIPLVSAPWSDCEHLFAPGRDFWVARDGAQMKEHMRTLLSDRSAAEELAAAGLRAVHARHTCAHRVDELLSILASLGAAPAASRSTARLQTEQPTL